MAFSVEGHKTRVNYLSNPGGYIEFPTVDADRADMPGWSRGTGSSWLLLGMRLRAARLYSGYHINTAHIYFPEFKDSKFSLPLKQNFDRSSDFLFLLRSQNN